MTALGDCYFPIYGDKGKKVSHQYLKDHSMDISDKDLAITIIEYELMTCDIPVIKVKAAERFSQFNLDELYQNIVIMDDKS